MEEKREKVEFLCSFTDFVSKKFDDVVQRLTSPTPHTHAMQKERVKMKKKGKCEKNDEIYKRAYIYILFEKVKYMPRN